MSKKSIRVMVVVVFILMAAGTLGYWWISVGQYQETTDNAYITADKIIVSTKLSGFVDSRWIKDNQAVLATTLLARIDNKDYQANLLAAQAGVEAAQADIESVKAQLVLQDSLIHEAAAAISANKIALVQAEHDVKRYTHLLDSGFSAEQKLESAVVAQEAARATLSESQAALESKKKQKQVFHANLDQVEASLIKNQAALDKAKDNMAHIMIRAPEDGVIAQRLVKSGEYVEAGAALFSLMDMDTVWVVANFKETQIKNIKSGQPVDIKVDSFSSQIIKGYVDSLSPGSGSEFSILPPENATGNFTKIVQRIPVKIVIPKGQRLAGLLRPGMSTEVTVYTNKGAINLTKLITSKNNIAQGVMGKHVGNIMSQQHHG